MSFSNEVKVRAQTILKRYLEGNYSSAVKNPILLLNYLYQHDIIPSPRYCVIASSCQSPHVVSCKIGEFEMLGSGNTNKIAKTNAAQQFLDLLLTTDNDSSMHCSLNGVTSQSFCSFGGHASVPYYNHFNNVISDSEIHLLNWINSVPFSNNPYSMETCIANGVSEPTLIDVEPQSGPDEVIHAQPQCDAFPKDDIISPKISEKNSTLQVNNISMVAHEQPSCDDFFDPFCKQRPPKSNTIVIEEKSTENGTSNQENQSDNTDKKSIDSMESKNVFALLQKKTQKHLKLIPRFKIVDTETGFRCNVQLGSYYATGEGKNKKEAKTKAAISLLNQMNDLN